MRAHGVPKPRPALLDQLRFVGIGSWLERAGPRVSRKRRRAAAPRERVPGRELADLAVDRQRCRNHVEREERLQGVEVDLTAWERVELGCERKLARAVAVVERLDPERVAGEHDRPRAGVVDGDREHAAQALPQPRAPLLVPVHEHLGVAPRGEPVARALELAAQLQVVVDLAVLHDDDGAVLVGDRLVAAGQVDDRKPPCGEPDAALDMRALGVRPAVLERRRHAREPLRVHGSARGGDSADAAHG